MADVIAPDRPPPEAGAGAPAPRPVAVRRRSPLAEIVLAALIALAKVAILGFAIDAFIHADAQRFKGKAMRTRVIGYVGGILIVPIVRRLLPGRDRYPRTLDLAVSVPLLLDAGGNALGMYQEAHVDDLVHVANAAIVSGVVGALAAPNVDERWQAAGIGAGVAVAGAAAWELAEYGAMRLGADGMDLTYEDSMFDLAEGFIGAAIGALVALTRLPRSRVERKERGWREPLGLRRERPA